MFKLFLDDMRIPSQAFLYTANPMYLDSDWVIVRSYDEFVDIIKERGIPDVLSFDHDLADEHYGTHENLDEIEYLLYEEKTGYHCAKWLIEYCIDNKLTISPKVYIHSMNFAGSKNIESLFRAYDKAYRGT